MKVSMLLLTLSLSLNALGQAPSAPPQAKGTVTATTAEECQDSAKRGAENTEEMCLDLLAKRQAFRDRAELDAQRAEQRRARSRENRGLEDWDEQHAFSPQHIEELALESDILLNEIGIPGKGANASRQGMDRFYGTEAASGSYQTDPGSEIFRSCQDAFGGRDRWKFYQHNFNHVNENAEIIWQNQWKKLHTLAKLLSEYYSKRLSEEFKRLDSTMKPIPSGASEAEIANINGYNSGIKTEKDRAQKEIVRFFKMNMGRVGVRLLRLQRDCAAMHILTSYSGSNKVIPDRAPKVSADGSIQCVSRGKMTQDYGPCEDFITRYEIEMAASLGLQTVQQAQVQFTQNNLLQKTYRRGPNGVGNQDASAALKTLLEQQKLATQQAGVKAAFETAMVGVFAKLAVNIPTGEDMLNYTQAVFPENHGFGVNQFVKYLQFVTSKAGKINDVTSSGNAPANSLAEDPQVTAQGNSRRPASAGGSASTVLGQASTSAEAAEKSMDAAECWSKEIEALSANPGAPTTGCGG